MKKDLYGLIHRKDGTVLQDSVLIGSFGGFGTFVYGLKGKAPPHFHLIEQGDDPRAPSSDIRILMDRADYYPSRKKGKLEDWEKRELIRHLKAPDEYFAPKTHRDVAVALWSMSNTENKISPKIPMPDYRKLP